MANQEHLDMVLKGPEAWNLWMMQTPNTGVDFSEGRLTFADLSGANLSGANLAGAKLRDAKLSDADFTRANLSGANLAGAKLTGADLSFADLSDADFTRANLSGANLAGAKLTGADLSFADLTMANLTDADLSGADLGWANFTMANLTDGVLVETNICETIFGNTDLSGAKGLELCSHSGPSTLDYRTIVRSGMLPSHFLRGCGMPDVLIDYLPSLLNQPIQFYSCFISYSTKDQEFADRLYADLQNKSVRCWFAPHDMQGGKKLHEQIDQAIRIYDRLLLILSPASINSEWVKTEIAKARKRELQEKRRMLFPVRLVQFEVLRDWEYFDSDAGKDSAREVREYYVPDFSNWKDHDCYKQELGKLLRDLKAP